jgi:hypothetical protein
MRQVLALAVLFLLPMQARANPFSKAGHWLKVNGPAALEHLALGSGTEVAVSYAAGGPRKYGAGILAAGLVAGFKEGADAVAKRDTKKEAAFHALTIVAGAGIAIGVTTAVRH